MDAGNHLPGIGKITRGISPNTLALKTIEFIESQLLVWREDETRPSVEAEEQLNSQLCKFLDDRARWYFPMAAFHHEERQGTRHRVDISAVPTSQVISATTRLESIYEPFLVIEGKRLPAPTRQREREYVTGFEERSGGMQRFRLCLHGASHPVAVIVGYIQSRDAQFWTHAINSWISTLALSAEDSTCQWTDNDQLSAPSNDGQHNSARCESTHNRVAGAMPIRLVHLWIYVSKL